MSKITLDTSGFNSRKYFNDMNNECDELVSAELKNDIKENQMKPQEILSKFKDEIKQVISKYNRVLKDDNLILSVYVSSEPILHTSQSNQVELMNYDYIVTANVNLNEFEYNLAKEIK